MSKKVQHVKLEDLAQKLNVSKVTISKALRDHPDISIEMKRKVNLLADELGYVPNFLAKNLSSRKSNIIGLVVPKIAHFFFGSIIESVYDTAFKNNYEIVLTVSQEMAARERKHILSLLSMKVDGLIVSVTQETTDNAIFERVKNMKVPLVFIDRVPTTECTSSVTVDDYGGAYSATEYFIKKRLTKIAHLGGYNHINIGKARTAGFTSAMNDYNIPINSDWMIEGGFAEEDGYEGFNRIFSKGPLPEAILAVTYPVALGFYEAAIQHGISIPDDVQITCFGSNSYKNMVPSVFNFVHQPAKELGEEAVKLILNLINNPTEFECSNIELKTQLMINGKSNKSVA
ncbi:MAG: LacI family DNA-binding transcriptional regulator [Ignavibacteria bacterium]|jgi:LacI family transcriptional regulator|nr:LacI family DNA-binding transcriptional regulator [Ignavibacteria bacterium]